MFLMTDWSIIIAHPAVNDPASKKRVIDVRLTTYLPLVLVPVVMSIALARIVSVTEKTPLVLDPELHETDIAVVLEMASVAVLRVGATMMFPVAVDESTVIEPPLHSRIHINVGSGLEVADEDRAPGGDVQVGVEHDGTGHHALHFNPHIAESGGAGAW